MLVLCVVVAGAIAWRPLLVPAVLAAPTQSVTGALDDAAVARAIRDTKSGLSPLELRDSGGLFSGFGVGYRITVYTPRSWVAQLATQAMATGVALAVADVEAADRAPLLRVVASPSTPMVGSSRDLSSAVLRVLVLDERRRSQLAPEGVRSFTARYRVLLGGAGALEGMEATFALAELAVLRGGADSEFFVRVEGTGYSKDFKIKRKHLDQLPL
jgi:hypothetical protein